MTMKPTEFWKNFKLGEELSIAGTFIYNGVRRFHELRKLDHTDELFEVLYNLAVGFERLLKLLVVMLEHKDTEDQETFEKSLITHNHPNLLARIDKHVKLNLGTHHNDFLGLLARFYKQIRYGRFTLTSVYDGKRERDELLAFLAKHLKVVFLDDSPLGIFNEDRYRKFMRQITMKISSELYMAVKERSRELNLYTYELRNGSKAKTVFLGGADIPAEDILWKELLIFFMNTEASNGYLKFLRGIAPLDLDPADVGDFLDCFQSDAAKSLAMDQLEFQYDEMDSKTRSERLETMKVIGNPNVYFPEDDDDEEEEGDVEPDQE